MQKWIDKLSWSLLTYLLGTVVTFFVAGSAVSSASLKASIGGVSLGAILVQLGFACSLGVMYGIWHKFLVKTRTTLTSSNSFLTVLLTVSPFMLLLASYVVHSLVVWNKSTLVGGFFGFFVVGGVLSMLFTGMVVYASGNSGYDVSVEARSLDISQVLALVDKYDLPVYHELTPTSQLSLYRISHHYAEGDCYQYIFSLMKAAIFWAVAALVLSAIAPSMVPVNISILVLVLYLVGMVKLYSFSKELEHASILYDKGILNLDKNWVAKHFTDKSCYLKHCLAKHIVSLTSM